MNFLVKKFIPNYENVEQDTVRADYGILSSVVGIVCNVLLFAVKLLIGMLINSIAVIADAFNNLSDAASAIISFIGVKMASKPADEEHPFGHGRIEYIAAFIVAFLVIQMGFSLFKSSIGKIINPEPVSFQLFPFLILILSVGVKWWMARFNKKLGEKIHSKVMLATAADSRSDVITTSATILTILISHFSGITIDAIAGIAVSVIVMWSGLRIAKDTLEPLIGEAVDPRIYREIVQMVESYDGIIGTHDLIVHSYGPNKSMATIHAEVPCDVDIERSHEIIDKIEREVSRKLGIFLVIHMDPVEVRSKEILAVKEQVCKVLQGIDGKISFHDFRMVSGEKQVNLIFDVVVTYEYDSQKQELLLQQIRDKMHQIDPRYQCIITIDQSYIAH